MEVVIVLCRCIETPALPLATPVVDLVSPEGRDAGSAGVDAVLDERGLLKEFENGTDREEVKEVKRGRMYENVDDCSGSEGGVGVGARGGGNQVCKDRRARSSVTCRCWTRSAFDPTM